MEQIEFLGTFNFNLDDKKRLTLPAKWRQILGNNVVISKGYDGCLELRSQTQFNAYYVKHLQNLNPKLKNSRLLLRQLLGNAADLSVDKAFRVLLPQNLLKLGSINRNVCLVGLGDVIEIWDETKYYEYQLEADAHLEDASENLN